MSGNAQQKRLQLALGLMLVLVIFLMEWVAVKPKGVYIHARTPAGPFSPGMDRLTVLDRINQVKSLRELRTCDPASTLVLDSRKGFSMSPDMAAGRIWILRDKKDGIFALGFKPEGPLDLILFLNEVDTEAQQNFLSQACRSELYQAPETFISTQMTYPVFPDSPRD